MFSPARNTVLIHAFLKSVLQLLVVFSILSLLFSSLTRFSFAQNELPQDTRPDPYLNVDANVPRDHHTFAQVALIDISSAILCQLVGIDLVQPGNSCLDINPTTQQIGYAPKSTTPQLGGVVGMSTQLISVLYIPPANTSTYIHYLADNFGIIKPAHAQSNGTGFNSIQGTVLDMYKLVRDIVYLLLVILFIVIGIAIMIRVKIDPRTVMTIQNQIPKLVMGIIFVTFSFAIAGFLIDTMWTLTYFSINAMTKTVAPCDGKPSLAAAATRDILNNPVAFTTDIFGDDTGCFGHVDGISGLAIDVGKTFGDVLSRTLLSIFGLDESLQSCDVSIFHPIKTVKELGTDCVKKGIFGILKYFIGIIGSLIIGIALVVTLFRIWFTLLKAYISIILGIILAPFWIILGLIPNGGLGISQWMRHMVAHLATYPATALMLILASIFARNGALNEPNKGVLLPPLIGNPNIADSMGTIIAFAIIMLAPDMMKIIRDALKTPQGKYTGNITGRAKVNPAAAIGSAGGMAYNYQMARQLPFLSKLPGLGGSGKGDGIDLHAAGIAVQKAAPGTVPEH